MSKQESPSQSRKVMRSAWQIARASAKRHGGRAPEYLRSAVPLAWKAVRSPAKASAEALVRALRADGFRASAEDGEGMVLVLVRRRDGSVLVGDRWVRSTLVSRSGEDIVRRWAVAYGKEITG